MSMVSVFQKILDSYNTFWDLRGTVFFKDDTININQFQK